MTPQKAAGNWIEPQVSEPMAKGTSPAPRPPRSRWRTRRTSGAVPRGFSRAGEAGEGLVVSHSTRQLDHGEFGRQDRARATQPAHDRRVVFEQLISIRLRAPGRRRAIGREEVLGAVGDAVKGTPVPARLELLVPLPGLRQRRIAEHRDHGVVGRPVALQSLEEVPGELDRGNLFPAKEAAQLGNGLE